MFVVLLTYEKDLAEVDRLMREHMRFVQEQYDAGVFVVSGRRVPRTGGVILARARTSEPRGDHGAGPVRARGRRALRGDRVQCVPDAGRVQAVHLTRHQPHEEFANDSTRRPAGPRRRRRRRYRAAESPAPATMRVDIMHSGNALNESYAGAGSVS
jgi:hypothetical protein